MSGYFNGRGLSGGGSVHRGVRSTSRSDRIGAEQTERPQPRVQLNVSNFLLFVFH